MQLRTILRRICKFHTEIRFVNAISGTTFFSQSNEAKVLWQFLGVVFQHSFQIIVEGRKDYLDLKIYDKTKALKLDLDVSYMRIELRFVGTTKIKRDFGTNLIIDFNDELITHVYQNTIERYIRKHLAKAQKKRNNKLLTILKKEHNKGDNGWITKSLRCIMNTEIEEAVPFLLDIHELFPFLETFTDAKGSPLSASRKYKIRESFISHASAYEKAFCKGDHEKLEEILLKI